MQSDQPHSIEQLKEAFSSFNETSEKLEQSYKRLESQTLVLRSDLEDRGDNATGLRLEAMGWMVTKIAHDIRNPLGSIELISSLLRKELSNDADKQKLIDHIIYGVKNIDNVLSNLLHCTHFPKPRFKMVSIKEILKKCIEVLSYVIEKNQIIITQEIPPDIRISGDDTLMKQVFMNILLNSLQSMKSGGHLSIRVSENVPGKEKGKETEICIKDSGSGISPENLDRIFDPFFTTKEKGTGLGLTVVHNIIKVHDGSIRVYSKSGEGTLVVVRVPEHSIS